MAARKFTLPALGRFAKYYQDQYIVGELSDLYDVVSDDKVKIRSGSWDGGLSKYQALQAIDAGHMESVAPSDKFLADVENILPTPTARNEYLDDVAGAVPNVPAFVAGLPLNMRRKVKRVNEAAPIAVIVNTTLSGGISIEDMQARGSAILALVRALSSRRPVELWSGTGIHADVGALWQLYRIETAPLDLARAAFILSHPCATRGIQYGVGRSPEYGFNGHWPYSSGQDKHIERAAFVRALPHVSEVLYIPSAHVDEASIKDPINWITENVKAYCDDVEIAA